jgi:hypothetical protein
MKDDGDLVAIGGMDDWQGKPKYWEKTCPSTALSTTDSTLLYQGYNPDHRGGNPATNRLSYGTAISLTD